MKGFKNKKGISLIVLVITIIVMIILAAAIILSISNSGIMDKANKAKTDSDTANLKEYANVLEAEWELMTADERSSSGYASKEEYVNKKLADKGYTGALLMEDGTLYTNLQANAKAALETGIEIGDVVTGYNITSKTIETSGKENTKIWSESTSSYEDVDSQPQSISNQTNLTWKFMGISENGNIMIVPSKGTGTSLRISGETGCLNAIEVLNDVCDRLYSTEKGTARSINVSDVNYVLEYTGTESSYFDGTYSKYITSDSKRTSLINVSDSYWLASLSLNSGRVMYVSMLYLMTGSLPFDNKNIRPVVEINADVSVSYSNGTLTLN